MTTHFASSPDVPGVVPDGDAAAHLDHFESTNATVKTLKFESHSPNASGSNLTKLNSGAVSIAVPRVVSTSSEFLGSKFQSLRVTAVGDYEKSILEVTRSLPRDVLRGRRDWGCQSVPEKDIVSVPATSS